MEKTGDILRRAQYSRRFKTLLKPSGQQMKQEAIPEPVHHSNHANYTALMRSHDRMRTRHIGGQGGGNGA